MFQKYEYLTRNDSISFEFVKCNKTVDLFDDNECTTSNIILIWYTIIYYIHFHERTTCTFYIVEHAFDPDVVIAQEYMM